MSLPEGGAIPWPPEHCGPVNAQYQIWAAWWAGDAERLAGIYAGDGGGAHDTTGFFASEAGGFKAGARRAIDSVRRWFWGSRQTNQSPSPRQRLHIPLAGDIATASADLLFAEPPTITADPDGPAGEQQTDQRAQDRINELWQEATHAVLLEAAEICAALGGVYLRLVWGPARTYPWITAVQPDVAVPEWEWGRLAAVTFWQEAGRKGKTVWRHLERHEPGLILHGLYQGTVDELGMVVPLIESPVTAHLADSLDDGNEIRTGTTRLTAVYVPNVRPNRIWRDKPEAAYLGRPDIAGTEPLLDALDLVWSSWVRDVDLSKARLVVPREYMQSQGPGQGATVDLDQEIYEPVNVMGAESGDKLQIQMFQPGIRVAEHSSSVDSLKKEIINSAGYSLGTFGMDGDGPAVTAKEIAARNRRSLTTRNRKARYWRAELSDLLETWTWVDATQYQSGIIPQRPQVEWPAAIAVDPLDDAQTLRELHTAEAISIEEKVRWRHPDWDDPRVEVEVEKIKADYGAGAADPELSLGGLAGNNPPPDPSGEGVGEAGEPLDE